MADEERLAEVVAQTELGVEQLEAELAAMEEEGEKDQEKSGKKVLQLSKVVGELDREVEGLDW